MSKRKCDFDLAEAYKNKILKYKSLLNDAIGCNDQDGLSEGTYSNVLSSRKFGGGV